MSIMNNNGGNTMAALPQSQAVYAKVQRRPRSPSITDAISNASSKEGKCTTIHVTLHKDRVYDDYGFSLSDGLYEKGVYINRIRSGGPADVENLLKPFDRILLVSSVLRLTGMFAMFELSICFLGQWDKNKGL